MVDLETVSTDNNAGIIALAAVPFLFGETAPVFYQKCSLQSVEAEGFHVSRSTLEWWDKQEEATRTEAFSGTQHINEMLLSFWEYVNQFKSQGFTPVIWGYGSMFDNVILTNAFDHFAMTIPWSYKQDMCFRTLKNVFDFVAPPVFIGDKHNALADATYQAQHAEKILKGLDGMREVLGI